MPAKRHCAYVFNYKIVKKLRIHYLMNRGYDSFRTIQDQDVYILSFKYIVMAPD
jgi:hypothetical protein